MAPCNVTCAVFACDTPHLQVFTKKLSFPTSDGRRLRGYHVEFSVDVKDPETGENRTLNFVAECPKFAPSRVWLNGKPMQCLP